MTSDPWEILVSAAGLASVVWLLSFTNGASSAWPWVSPALILLALIIRRSHPFPALALACGAMIVTALAGGEGLLPAVGAQTILFSATLTLGRTRSVVPAVAMGAAVYASVILGGGDWFAGTSLATLSWTLGVWGIAAAIYSQRESLRQWQERARRWEQSVVEELRRTVAEERLRIARDLHDELAHQIAVISMNTGAAELALADDEEAAKRALLRVRTASRRVLSELQQIVGILRADGDEEGRGDVAAAHDASALIDSARASGLIVTAPDIDFTALDPRAGLAAYRALQECLTNARRHSGGEIEILVSSEGGIWAMTARNALSPQRPASSSGFGLSGMRERVQHAGGAFRVEENDEEFSVHIELPILPGAHP